MNLHKLIFTNNACYRAGRRITHGTLHRRQQPLAQALCGAG